MSFEELKAAAQLLLEEMENKPDDAHELHLQLRELLDQMRATGMPLPDDLVAFEKQLEHDVEGVEE